MFIEPDNSLRDDPALHETLAIDVRGRHTPLRWDDRFLRQPADFRRIAEQINSVELLYDDQCSLRYYVDMFRALRRFHGKYTRVVEVGVFMGGSSSVIAGAQSLFGYEFDLVDIWDACLQFTAERIRRTFPDATFRLWHGDLPSYVRHVLMEEDCRVLIQHDGAHDFNTVVADLASLSFVKDKVHALMVQDTNLRGSLKYMNFVDMALMGVFGTGMKSKPIGLRRPFRKRPPGPDQWFGNYTLFHKPEGQIVKLSRNQFEYPHPEMTFDSMYG